MIHQRIEHVAPQPVTTEAKFTEDMLPMPITIPSCNGFSNHANCVNHYGTCLSHKKEIMLSWLFRMDERHSMNVVKKRSSGFLLQEAPVNPSSK
jgi:hypothetical protein